MDKQQYDLQKREKEETKTSQARQRTIKKILLWVVPLVIVVGTGVFMISRIKIEPPEADHSVAMADEGRTHVSQGTDVEYRSNPPTSGNHWPTPLSDGVYNKEKPDEAIVHSLEHGRVWISYKPTISEEIKKKLEKLGGGQGLIVTPREANETDIALAAWTRLDTFNLASDGTLPEKRIKDFILRYKNKGPEFIPGSGGGSTY